jgi:VanZ family protein
MAKRMSTFLLDEKYQAFRLRSAFAFYFLIIALGSVPHAREAIGQFAPGAILHSLAYSAITFLLFTGSRGSLIKRSLSTILIVALMGALDETVQSFFPYRTSDLKDWLVDCGASMITLLLLCTFWPTDSRLR